MSCFASSLECQYTKSENYTQIEPKLAISSEFELLDDYGWGDPLIITDNGKAPGGIPVIKVMNPNDKEVSIDINYTQIVTSSLTGTSKYGSQKEGIRIPANDFVILEAVHGFDSSYTSYIDLQSLKYVVTEPRLMTVRNIKVLKTREICQTCAQGLQCLNDGHSCNPIYDDAKCGSGICNIAGFCGHIKIVDCPNGKLNCNDKICLTPSTKGEGEAYECQFECKSDRYDDGKCLKSSEELFAFMAGLIILTAFGAGLIAIPKIRKARKLLKNLTDEFEKIKSKKEELDAEAKILATTIQKLNGNIAELNQKIGALNKKKEDAEAESKRAIEALNKQKQNAESENKRIIQELNTEIELAKQTTKKSIKILNKKIRNAKGDAKLEFQKQLKKEQNLGKKRIKAIQKDIQMKADSLKEIENDLNVKVSDERRKLNDKMDEIDSNRKEIQYQEQELSKRKRKLELEQEEIERKSREQHIKKLEQYYKQKYEHASSNVFYDKDAGYFKIKFKNGNLFSLQKHIYYNKITENLQGKEIHHIDYDELNNELWNLIAIDKNAHKNFKHYRVTKGDWLQGYNELKSQLEMKNEDFPEHIRKHLKKLTQQKLVDKP